MSPGPTDQVAVDFYTAARMRARVELPSGRKLEAIHEAVRVIVAARLARTDRQGTRLGPKGPTAAVIIRQAVRTELHGQ